MGDAIIPNDWEGEYCKFALCWPNSPQWLAVLRGIITIAASGRFWNEATGTITEAQAIVRETYDYNFRHEEVIVACGDTALADIASALRMLAISQQQLVTVQANCCTSGGGGSGGAGDVAPPFSPIEQTNPSTTPPPDGFEDWEQFFANKCAVATDIWTVIKQDCNTMSTVNFVGLTLLGGAELLIPLLLDPIPGDEIMALVALLIAAITEGHNIVSLMIDSINDVEDDFICALYNGSSAEVARTDALEIFNTDVNASAADPVAKFEARTAMSYILNASVVNRLFTLEANRDLPAGDCSGCACALSFVDGLGTGDLFPDGEIRTLNSVLSGGFHQIVFAGDCACSGGWQVEIVSLDGYIVNVGGGSGSGDRGGLIRDCDNNDLWSYGEEVEPSGPYCGSLFGLGSIAEGAWSADVRISQGCLE